MKFYVGSRLKHTAQVKELTKKLENKGYFCTHKWTDGKKLKPYEKNITQSQVVANQQAEAIKKAMYSYY
ncbi:MAG: hypothetical protein WD335_00170 [Candidatus Paceibacterota bacterium]